MAVRLGKVGDAPEIQRIYKSDRGVEAIVGVDYDESDWSAFVETPHTILLVAEEEGRPVGFLMGYDLKRWGYVDVLVVDRQFRGRGIGSDLLRRFEGHGAGRWGFVELCVDMKDGATKGYVGKTGFRTAGKAEWFVKPLALGGGDEDARK